MPFWHIPVASLATSTMAMMKAKYTPAETEVKSLVERVTSPSSRWQTHDKELSATVEAFKTWRHCLEHAPSMIHVLSDHNNLRYFMTMRDLFPNGSPLG